MTQGLATRIKHLLDRLRAAGGKASALADPLSLPPVAIRSAADLETAAMQQAWTLLEAKRGDRAFLSRADIDPGDLKPVLSAVGLIEVHYDPLSFRIRLAGTGWRDTLGFEATGLWLHDWPDTQQKQVLELSWITAVVERRAGRARRHAVVGNAVLHYEAVMIPLATDGETIDMLLTMSAPWHSDAPPMVL